MRNFRIVADGNILVIEKLVNGVIKYIEARPEEIDQLLENLMRIRNEKGNQER